MEISEMLARLGVPTAPENHHHRTPYFEQVDCPYCSPCSDRFRMGVALDGSRCVCWYCGSHNIYETLKELAGSRSEVVEWLGDVRKNYVFSGRKKKRGRLVLPSGIIPLMKIHREYLRERGLDPEELERLWGVRATGPTGRFPWRLFIPLKKDGRVVSWTLRRLHDNGKRYWSARPDQEELSHKEILGGADLARNGIVIVEGPFDAMRVGPGAVWTSGTSFTKSQVLEASRFPLRVIAFDSELGAQRQALKMQEALGVLPGRTVRVELDSPDPGSATEREIQLLRRMIR